MFCGWGDGLVGKVLAVQTRGPEFDPLHPRKKCQMQQYVLVISALGRLGQEDP